LFKQVILMISVNKIIPYLPIQVTQYTLIKVDLGRRIALYFSTETYVIAKNTDNTVIILST